MCALLLFENIGTSIDLRIVPLRKDTSTPESTAYKRVEGGNIVLRSLRRRSPLPA